MHSRPRPVVLLLVGLLLCACTPTSGGSTGSTTGTASTSSSSQAAPSARGCAFGNDLVHAKASTVRVQAPRSALTVLQQDTTVTCSTLVRADQGGIADVTFGKAATCELQRIQALPGTSARLTTRDPPSVLLRLGSGQVSCTVAGQTGLFRVCDFGTMASDGSTVPVQVKVTCDPDPMVTIEAYAGSLHWTTNHGEAVLVPTGSQLVYDRASGRLVRGTATFTVDDDQVFAAQAGALGVTPKVPPMNREAPAVSGPDVSGLATTSDGQWAGSPDITFGYQWQHNCDQSGAKCTDIATATTSTYQTVPSDCPFVRVEVTGSNAYGSATATSATVFVACAIG